MSISRRKLIKNAGVIGATGLVATKAGAMSSMPPKGDIAPKAHQYFNHGVASGDPLFDRVILWTRVTPFKFKSSIKVQWKIATDINMQNVVNSGEFTTNEKRDYTVKVDANGLMPGSWYYYQFSVGGRKSMLGRTKTAEETGLDRLRLAVVSCSSLPHGYFNVYRALAKRNDLDAIVHLGDYIYEYGQGQYGNAKLDDVRALQPAHEIKTLEDYRTRHAQYKADEDLQAAHQQYPFIVTWDDHEFANDTWVAGAENHNKGEGDFFKRKAAAKQAYFEWMPIRVQPEDFEAVYRVIKYGNLVDLIMLDTRIEGRDEQLNILHQHERHDPNRTLLGFDQEQWLHNQLSTSTAQWKILGQQVMIQHRASIALPDKLGGGLSFFLDSWDGYTSTRKRLFNHVKENKIDNFVVLTGDIHSTWVADLCPDPYDFEQYNRFTGEGAIGVEFVTPSITSPALPPVIGDIAAAAFVANSPHLKYCDMVHHGYFILDVTKEKAQADWFFIDTIEKESIQCTHAVSYKSVNKQNKLTKVAKPTEVKPHDVALVPNYKYVFRNN